MPDGLLHTCSECGGYFKPEDEDEWLCEGCENWKRDQAETDPNGKNPHELGAKLDSGKPRVALMLSGFARALLAVAEVTTHGANKYTPGGWEHVENGIERYADAKDRHRLRGAFESHDKDSKLLHKAHEAWNALAELELILRDQEING